MSFLSNFKRKSLRKQSSMALKLLEKMKSSGRMPKEKADRLIKELRESIGEAEKEGLNNE